MEASSLKFAAGIKPYYEIKKSMFGTLFLSTDFSLLAQENTNKGVWMPGCTGSPTSRSGGFKEPTPGYPKQIKTYKHELKNLAIVIGFPVDVLRERRR